MTGRDIDVEEPTDTGRRAGDAGDVGDGGDDGDGGDVGDGGDLGDVTGDRARAHPRILVACMGNILRGDDGFGVAVARELEAHELPAGVDVREVGISGVSMAQDLMEGFDALVLVDAMERHAEPGTLFVERAEVPDLDQYEKREIGSFAADMHQTDPSKVLVLGEALGVLPERTILVGCEPLETDDLEDSLSDPVREAIPRAIDHIETIVDELRSLDHDPEGS